MIAKEVKNPLTPREMEVVKYLLLGYTNKKIAEIMFITEATVKKHVSSIFQKAGAKNRLDLALHAIANGYANPHQDSGQP